MCRIKQDLYEEWHIIDSTGIVLSDEFDEYQTNFGVICSNSSLQAITLLAARECLWHKLASRIEKVRACSHGQR